jgi:hypothetical protein
MTAAHQKVAVLKNLNKCTMHNIRLILWSPAVSNTSLCLPLILNYILNTLVAFVCLVLLHAHAPCFLVAQGATFVLGLPQEMNTIEVVFPICTVRNSRCLSCRGASRISTS